MTLSVTLNEIAAYHPCKRSWSKALEYLGKTEPDDMEISFRDILDAVGLDDALWCLRVLPKGYAGHIRLLACDFAESVLHLVPDGEDRPRKAIETARRYVRGDATETEMSDAALESKVAQRTAWENAWDTKDKAIRAAAWAAEAAEAVVSESEAINAAMVAAAAADAAAECGEVWVDELEKQKQIFLKWLEQF